MDAGGPIRAGLLLLVCACVAAGSPIGTSEINCATGSNGNVGQVNEGYSGEVEVVRGITGGVKLVAHVFPAHLQFLELSFAPGDATATVRTKRPLDADELAPTDSTLYYSIMCDDVTKYNNTRTLKINDLNDNSPIFGQKSYSASVSE